MAITVVFADGKEPVRKLIALLLASDPDIEVVGEAADLIQTEKLIKECHPNVVVMDLRIGRQAVASMDFKSMLADGRLLAISLWIDADTSTLAETMGATILLDKEELGTKLIPAIKTLCLPS